MVSKTDLFKFGTLIDQRYVIFGHNTIVTVLGYAVLTGELCSVNGDSMTTIMLFC